MSSFKQQCIVFCIKVYNILYDLWLIYSCRLNKIWTIGTYILKQNEVVYYFKDKNEYPVPLYLLNINNPLILINKCIVKENCIECNTSIYDSKIRGKKYFECLAATLYINNMEYEVPSNLLCIKSASNIIITYEQWIQIVYSELNIQTIDLPAKIVFINDMGEEKIVKIGLEFNELINK